MSNPAFLLQTSQAYDLHFRENSTLGSLGCTGQLGTDVGRKVCDMGFGLCSEWESLLCLALEHVRQNLAPEGGEHWKQMTATGSSLHCWHKTTAGLLGL